MEEAETLKLGFIFVCLEILQSCFYGLEKIKRILGCQLKAHKVLRQLDWYLQAFKLHMLIDATRWEICNPQFATKFI